MTDKHVQNTTREQGNVDILFQYAATIIFLLFGLQNWYDKICMIIDVQGFIINREFIPRELGYATTNGKYSGVYYFDIGIQYDNLQEHDKIKSIRDGKKTHGLSFNPKEAESPHKVDAFGDIVISLYEKYKEPGKNLVGYRRTCILHESFIMQLRVPVKPSTSGLQKLLRCPFYES